MILAALLLMGAAQTGLSQAGAEYALIVGTVFRDPGFALPGVAVVLTPKAGNKKSKVQKTATDRRGEFTFRVPPGPGEYVILVKADGFEAAEKSLRIEASERVDQYFTLKATPKKD